MNAVLYIHGKGGSAEESEHYTPLFPGCKVIGLDYVHFTPWEAGKEIKEAALRLKKDYKNIIIIANSIGAYFSMHSDIENDVSRAFFISPIVDMEKLIDDMMRFANISEEELKDKGTVLTDFGEELSWEYLCYARKHPVKWSVKTDILYGEKDNLTSIETVTAFAISRGASLTVMQNGEHWFHTEEHMRFLDEWIVGKMRF